MSSEALDHDEHSWEHLVCEGFCAGKSGSESSNLNLHSSVGEKKKVRKSPSAYGMQCGWPGLSSCAASPPSPLGLSAGCLCKCDCSPYEQYISLPKEPEE